MDYHMQLSYLDYTLPKQRKSLHRSAHGETELDNIKRNERKKKRARSSLERMFLTPLFESANGRRRKARRKKLCRS